MKITRFLLVILCLSLNHLSAQVDTAHHRAVYKSINEGLKHFHKQTVAYKHEGVGYRLEGWLNDGEIVKIVVRSPADKNFGTEEYYIENGKPLFVFRVRDMLDSETGETMIKRAENRFYFRDGHLFKWLDCDKAEVSTDDEAFGDEGEWILMNFKMFINAFNTSSQTNTKYHRAAYKSINEGIKRFDKRTAACKHEGLVCQLEGWIKEGEFVKITVKCPSDEKFGCEEYYIENGKPLFVYRVRDMLDSETGEVMVKGAENRFYFRGGQLFKWIDYNKSEVSSDDEIFGCEGEAISLNCKKFIIALSSTGN